MRDGSNEKQTGSWIWYDRDLSSRLSARNLARDDRVDYQRRSARIRVPCL